MIFIHTIGSAGRRWWPRITLPVQAGRSWKALHSNKEAEVETVRALPGPEFTPLDSVCLHIFFSDSHSFIQRFFELAKWCTWLCDMTQTSQTLPFIAAWLIWVIEGKTSLYPIPTPQVLVEQGSFSRPVVIWKSFQEDPFAFFYVKEKFR